MARETADISPTSGKQFLAIYAVPTDGFDEGLDTSGLIADAISAMNGWIAAKSDGRKLRWSMTPAEDGPLVVFVALSQNKAFYRSATSGATIVKIKQELQAKGFNNPDKSYAVWYEGDGGTPTLQGLGGNADHRGQFLGDTGVVAVYMDGAQWGDLHNQVGGTSQLNGMADWIMMHEILHILGAVHPSAPNHTTSGGNGGDHTASPNEDIMEGASALGGELDPGRNDYFQHSGSWIDVADQPYWILAETEPPEEEPPVPPPVRRQRKPQPPEFTYFTTDLRTNAALTHLPLVTPRFSTRLKTIGDLTATLPLRSLSKGRRFTSEQLVQERVRELIAGTVPNRTALWVDFGGSLVWGGIITARNYTEAQGSWQLQAKEFMWFFEDKFFHRDTGDINLRLELLDTDQFEIVRQLMAHVQNKSGANINITVTTGNSGVLRDRTYRVTKYKHILEALDELSNVVNGFDYYLEVFYDTTNKPAKRLVLSYPRRGVKSTTSIMFEFPGNVANFVYPEDGLDFATRAHANGTGEGREMLRSFQTNTARIAQGWPLYETHTAYSTIKRQSTLDDHAKADLDANDQPLTLPKLTVPVDSDYPLGSFTVGDHARVRLNSVRFPDGFDERQRILGYAVDPDSRMMELEMGRVDPLL